MSTPTVNFLSARLLAILLLLTATVMAIFISVRYSRALEHARENLKTEGNVIATRVANAVRPTIWNVYKKSSSRKFSEELTSAILDAEMLSPNIVAIRVFGNFGHLFMARVKIDGEIVTHNPERHKALKNRNYLVSKQPIKNESYTIGSVEILLSDTQYIKTQRKDLQLDFLQVIVIGLLILIVVYIVLEKALVKPLLQLQIAKQTLETMEEGVVVAQFNGTVTDANRCFLALFNFTEEHLYQKNFRIQSLVQDPTATETIRMGLRKNQQWAGEVTLLRSEQKPFPAWLNINIIRDQHRKIVAFVIVVRDMTELKAKEEALQRLAYQDTLTKLENRASFERKLKQDIAICERLNKKLCLLYIDLDDFKTVNDAFGHEAGDQLLIEISERFSKRLRTSDTLARIGGDEFTVIIPDLQQTANFTKIGKELISLAGAPVILGDSEVYVGASIGAAFYPQDGKTVTELLKHADVAMYRSKSRGRNRLSFYSQKLETHSHLRIALESDLRHAIKNNAFELYYQAKVLMSTNTPTGFEVLLRWKRDDGTFVSPSEFIPIAEERGLIIPLGRWIIHNALKQIKIWHQKYSPDISLAINISPVQFHDNELLEFLKNEILTFGINPAMLEIEITETTIIRDIEYSAEFLKSLKSIGVKISIDDFGTGYSSLRYLQHLPIDTLKIDRVFVNEIELANKNQAIAKTVISLADNLNLDVVVEGVELEAQAKILSALGCTVGQGFLFARPVPAEEVEKLLAKQHLQTTTNS